jgi:polar amino acid transport system permease protein
MQIKRITTSLPASILQYLIIVGLIIYAAYSGSQTMGYNWQWSRVPQYIYEIEDGVFVWKEIPRGMVGTIILSAISFIIAIGIGLALALLRLSDLIIGRALSITLLEIIRNIPIIVLLYVCYYIFGRVFDLDRYAASVLCLSLYSGVQISEIIRAGINAVPKGQWEASSSIGMSKAQAYRYIIIPQSIRLIIPPMTGEAVQMIRNSAIVSVIAVLELTTAGRNIISDTYMSFEIWFTVAAVYLVFTLILSIFVSGVERRFATQTQ